MKKIFLVVSLLLTYIAYGQKQELKLGADVWPLFTNVENEKSILTDLVSEALSRSEISSTFEIDEFSQVLSKIDNGEYDGSPGLWISEARKEKYLFSKPYLYNQLILVGRRGSDVSAKSFSDLEGKRIGVVSNYEYGDFDNSENLEIIPDLSNQKNLENLLSEKIDYMLVDALLIQYMLKHQLNDVTKYLAIGQSPLMVKSLHLALGKNVKNAQEILDDFDKTIEAMTTDKSFNRILELNWVRADVDGDGKTELVLGSNMAGSSAPKNIYGLMMDNSYKQNNEPQRYYVDGKLYEDWDKVPKSYKLDLVEDNTPSEKDTYIRLDF
ncbi:transporter substrate-binding domain-containing protein [Lutimonas saemankumensis]|uniref:substrate-binding periplasmic protein n=1 Tax=Lutimonas saemankumensis TaxID=483016 RepID=UPI001CD486CC|nr:transporter substrate-binding domain-containing protein [Lutimonas saemankumensis]MCA0933406.1 transporter substrate-binding domain-containing protein [Lutimonas saemankumensis]